MLERAAKTPILLGIQVACHIHTDRPDALGGVAACCDSVRWKRPAYGALPSAQADNLACKKETYNIR